MDAACKGKKFGHNFPVAGGPCLNCGISQNELSEEPKPKKLKETLSQPFKQVRGIHSEIHALAKDISEYCGEPKKFALYLGVIKRIGKNRACQIFSEIKQSKDIKSRAKMFMYLSRDKKSPLREKVKMILSIQKGENNPILRQKSTPIKNITEDILDLIKDMTEIMIKVDGVGLAACQIGKNIRLFMVNPKLSKKYIFINPEIYKISKKTETIEEGCLSLPNVYKKIPRAKSLKIKAIDENGKEFKLKARGLPARVIQHEIDHLNGKLIID